MSHTRTPWKMQPGSIHIYDECGRALVNPIGHQTSAEEDTANAAFIVKAVNAHDELVDALNAIDLLIPALSLPLTHQIKEIVQTALAKAGAL